MPKISKYTRKVDRDAAKVTREHASEWGKMGGRPKVVKDVSPEGRIERDIKNIQKRALVELRERAETMKDMDLESLLKVLKSCGDALKGVKQIRSMDQDTGDGFIRFETVMADRKGKE